MAARTGKKHSAAARSPASSDCSVVGTSTVGGRRRSQPVITRGRKRPRVRMERKHPYKWTAEATAHFLEAAIQLADDGSLYKHKFCRLACRRIRDKMVEKGSPEVSLDVVRSKFNTFMADWKGYNELKLMGGSCFNPVTATFDAPKEWWDNLGNKKLKKFQKGIPHMRELDQIFSHMECPPICRTCGSNSLRRSTTTPDLGYQRSESIEQRSLSHMVPGYAELMNELEQAGVAPDSPDFVTAVNLLRCPQLRTMYSKRASIGEKVTMLRMLREQGATR